MQGETIRTAKQIDLFRCYFNAVLNNAGETVPEEKFIYLSVAVPGSELKPEGMSIKARIGSFSGTMTMDVCEGDQLSSEVRISLSGNTFNASAVNHFQETIEDPQSGEIGLDEKMSGSFNISLADGASVVDTTTVENADISVAFDGNFGLGSMTFGFDGLKNDVSGFFQGNFGEGDTFTGRMAAQSNATEGACKYSATGTFPGIPSTFIDDFLTIPSGQIACPIMEDCDPMTNFSNYSCMTASPDASCFCLELVDESTGCSFTSSGTEAYTISYDASAKQKSFTIADTSTYLETVTGTTLPDASDVSIVFADNWDCSGTFTEVSVTAEDIATCTAMEEEAFAYEDHDSCAQGAGEGSASDGGSEFESVQTEAGGLLPAAMTFATTAYTDDCVADISGSWPDQNYALTVSRQNADGFWGTFGGTAWGGWKVGENWISDGDPNAQTPIATCNYTLTISFGGVIEPFNCTSFTATYTRTSGDCSLIIGGGSCTVTAGSLTCTVP